MNETAINSGAELEPTDEAIADHGGSSRRAMLRNLALGVAAAGTATVIGNAASAEAADGDNVVLGQTKEHTTTTTVNYKGPTVASSFNIQSGDQTAANDGILNSNFANGGTTLLGVASGNGNQLIGITGWSKKPLGTGIVGFTGGAGAYGGEFFGGLAEVRLRPGGAAPITLTNAHQVGEMYEDETGILWICVSAGSPGSWREISGPTSSGAFHAIAPRRVYDSRNSTKLVGGVDRDISVAAATDGTPDVIPAASTAVALSVTVTQTETAGGYVAVRPQGNDYAGTSSINWFGPNQDLATTVISGLGGDRMISARSSAPTHFIVDVTGYYR